MFTLPISYDLIKKIAGDNGIPFDGSASIREISFLTDLIEKETGIPFIRMEMGIPGLQTPAVAIEAEINALQKGIASLYPNVAGISTLKMEASRFMKLFLNADIRPEGCIPTVGSMMGSILSFMVANRNDSTKGDTLFLDPGFPVHKQQVKMTGHDYQAFDIYNFRGKKLRNKLESYYETGKISSLLYSNPNNPAWICLNEEELGIIGELSNKYDVIVIEDLAYFGMDFRKDYSHPGVPPYQPSVAHFTDHYIILVSGSKIFSYAGQRIGLMAVSDKLFKRSYPDLRRYYSSDNFGHSLIFGALYGMTAGVPHSVQYGLAALFKTLNDGTYNYHDDVKVYERKASAMKNYFISNGFEIVYDTDLDLPVADGFYFTVGYPGMTGKKLLLELLRYGISSITLDITGSKREGLRACVSLIPWEMFPDLEKRLRKFNEDHTFN